jgi:PAS domain S-box-containing protein
MTRATVLVVDDSEHNRYLLRTLLQGHGFQVEEVRNGAEALSAARRAPPQLVICDLLMPVMDGYALLRQWHADAQLRDVPVIVHTATYTDPQDEQLALTLGADAFVAKPTEPEDLMVTVNAVLARAARRGPVTQATSLPDDEGVLRLYSEVLIAKLERKTLQLEQGVVERDNALQALRSSEARYRALFDNSLDIILQTKPDGQIEAANAAACSAFQMTEAQVIAAGREGLVDTTDPRLPLLLAERAATGKARGEMRFKRADGTRFEGEISANNFADASGVQRSCLIVRDVTARRRGEEAVREREAATQANKAKSEFLSRMSHELRTPLNAVIGFSQLLGNDPLAPLLPAQRSKVDHIQRAGVHLLGMVNEVLDLARIESGVVNLVPAAVSLQQVLADSLPMVLPQARAQGVSVIDETGAAGAVVWGDAQRLRQVFLNLLSNAIKYNRHGGEVRIASSQRPGEISLVVADTGVGLRPEQCARLFEPFERLGAESTAVEGTGLGLVITRGLVQAMGGSIGVVSEFGVGTTVTVRLPAANAELAAESRAPVEPAPSGPSAQPATVLYIEDNELNVLLVQAMFERRPALRLTIARDGTQGLAQARQAQPDLVLIDMNLPDMDGAAVLAALRQWPGLAAVPCIATSADVWGDAAERAHRSGFADFWPKPMDVPTFLRRLDTMIEQIVG